MSLSLLERSPTPDPGSGRRWWKLPERPTACTLFVTEGPVWSYAGGTAPAEASPGLEPWLAANPGANARIVLSGALTHQLVVSDPALPIADAEALLAWARHQFVHYHGSAAQRWPLSVWLSAGQRGASAAHGIDLDAVLRRAADSGVRVRAVQPWWAVALQAATLAAPTLALADRAELWIVEGQRVTRVGCGQGRVRQIEQHWLSSASLSALAARLAECEVPSQTTWVLGYGLQPGEHAPLVARPLGELQDAHPAPAWLGV